MEYVLGGIAGITGVASLYLIVSWTYMKTHSMWCLMSIFAHIIGTAGLSMPIKLDTLQISMNWDFFICWR